MRPTVRTFTRSCAQDEIVFSEADKQSVRNGLLPLVAAEEGGDRSRRAVGGPYRRKSSDEAADRRESKKDRM